MTYYAKVKCSNSSNPVIVQVEARDIAQARKLIEAQYTGCKITTSPTTSRLR